MLTPKQESFRKALLETGDAETAYRAVYNCSGMSPSQVKQKATRELAKVEEGKNDSYQNQSGAFGKNGSHQRQAGSFDEGDSYQNQPEPFGKKDSYQWMDFNNASPQTQPRAFRDGKHDTDRLKARLLERIEEVLFHLLPAGRVRHGKFLIGDVEGNPGESMKVELTGNKTGVWYDHATGLGGDILDLWARTRGLNSHSDFPRLLDEVREWLGGPPRSIPASPPHRREPPLDDLGPPTGKWNYHDQDGALLVCVYRYDPPGGKKQFRPWDVRAREWRAPTDHRPLYNLPGIARASEVVLVEGEKAAQALIDAGVVATTSMHGSNAPVEKTDWTPLVGKRVAEQTSEAVQQGDQVVVGSKAAAARAIEQMQKAAQIENQAFREEAGVHQEAADTLHNKSEAATEALARIREAVKGVDEALAKDHTLLIDANIEKIRAAGAEIDALLEKKERVVRIKAELQGGATALESVVGNVLQGEMTRAQASLDEVSRVFTKFKTEFTGWQPEVKATFDTVSATGAIDGLMAKFQEFKNSVPPEEKVTIVGDTGQAVAAIDTLIARIAEIPSEKTVTVNTVERRSEAHAQGGMVGFARGGFLPGWGGGDKIRALLEAGEFVLNRHAVRLYGLERLQAMNQLRLKPTDLPRFAQGGVVRAMPFIPRFRMPSVPRFQFGGLAKNLVIPTIPPMALAGGGAVTPQVEGVVRLELVTGSRQEPPFLTGSREQVRGFVRALQEMQRGLG
ncbi:MAG: hypothetical protein HQL59_06285 [Magnetococcales bacterium]|nr:hypothetical protein [Magnetococcales bacterium]